MDNVAGSDGEVEHMELPNKARLVETRLVEKPSIPESLRSVASNVFGSERMVRAHHGHYHRQSLEENCLEAEGEDLSMSGMFIQHVLGDTSLTKTQQSPPTIPSVGPVVLGAQGQARSRPLRNQTRRPSLSVTARATLAVARAASILSASTLR